MGARLIRMYGCRRARIYFLSFSFVKEERKRLDEYACVKKKNAPAKDDALIRDILFNAFFQFNFIKIKKNAIVT
jgi:hypothetical protein